MSLYAYTSAYKSMFQTHIAPTAEDYERMFRAMRPETPAEREAKRRSDAWCDWVKGIEQRRRAHCRS